MAKKDKKNTSPESEIVQNEATTENLSENQVNTASTSDEDANERSEDFNENVYREAGKYDIPEEDMQKSVDEKEKKAEEIIHDIEEDVKKMVESDETIKEVNEGVERINKELENIGEKILNQEEDAPKAIQEQINAIKELKEKIDNELLHDIPKDTSEGEKKLKKYFKNNNFAQFWNGVSSGWD